MENSNRIAIITGGSRNIGKETALKLAASSVDVIITYKTNADMAEDAVSQMESMGAKAKSIQLDLSDPITNIENFLSQVQSTLKEWGREKFDILVNNAGILKLGTFDKISPAELDAIYNVNYKAPFFLTQSLLPYMKDGGNIVNLGSGTARIAFGPLVSYGPLKAALQSLTLYLANFLGDRKIKVNAVSPGGLDDDFNTPLFEMMPPAKDFIKSNTALDKIGKPNDVSKVIAFLCSEDADFINGSIINVDGGYHL